ncbi:MAG: hypothetical protein ACUZ8I_01055 [Candidatus Scalindua sp.]
MKISTKSLFHMYCLKPRACMRGVKKDNSLVLAGMATILRYRATIAVHKQGCKDNKRTQRKKLSKEY